MLFTTRSRSPSRSSIAATGFFPHLLATLRQLPEASPATLILSLLLLLLMVGLPRLAPRLPVALVALVVAAAGPLAGRVHDQRRDPDGDLLQQVPVKSTLAWVYAYQYPVHRIKKDYTPAEPAEQPVFIAVYRRSDDSVGFLELNPVTARLLEAIDNNDEQKTGEALLRALADEINYSDADALVQHGAAALDEMRQLEILTGTRVPAWGDL